MTKRTRSDPTSDAVPTATAIMPTDSDATSDAVLAEPALIPTGSDAKKVTVWRLGRAHTEREVTCLLEVPSRPL